VANHVAQARKIVLVPYFTCGTVFQPFWENGWETVYYKVTRDLKIDTQDVEALYEQYKPSIAIFMEYSGMDLTESELQTIGKLKQAGCVTIVDRSQNIYSTQYAKEVDFYCGSLRKWYCCPDGAYLQKNGDIPLPPVPDAAVYNVVYATLCSVMMFTNALARKTNIKQYLDLASFFRKLSASYVRSQQVRTRNMSEYSKAVYLQEQNKDQTYMQRRSENFHYIYQRIASFSLMHPVCSDLSRFTSTPFYFHIYTRDRSDLSRFLTARGIATWVN
jgi:selenocysteine lyase/cysteine desulfurase